MNEEERSFTSIIPTLCSIVRERRLFLGLSQADLGNRAGLNRSYVNAVEKGDRNLSLDTLYRLASALETTASQLLAEAESALTASHKYVVLLVEDNPADIYIIKRALAQMQGLSVRVVEDGAKALDYLQKAPGYEESPEPNVILLDLNLPKRTGFEVLEKIKTSPKLKHIPTVIVTTSSAKHEILRSYQLHANSLITKPVEPEAFQSAIAEIVRYWLKLANLPPPQRN